MIIINSVPHYTYAEVAELLNVSENIVRRTVIELERPYIVDHLRVQPKRMDKSLHALFSLDDLQRIDTFLQLRYMAKEKRPVLPKQEQQTMSP